MEWTITGATAGDELIPSSLELDFEIYIAIVEDLEIDGEEPLLPPSNSDFEETEEDEEMTEQEPAPALMDTMKALDTVLHYLLKSNIFEN